METEMKLPPNTKYECISETFWFTVGKTYKTNSDGLIMDDSGDEREVISVQDNYFFERFKKINSLSEIAISEKFVSFYEGILSLADHSNTVEFLTSETIALRNFLNQLDLGEK